VPKCWIFGGLAFLGGFLAGAGAMLAAGRVEIEAPIVVLLTVWRAGAPIMKSNEKFWLNHFSQQFLLHTNEY